MDTQRKESFARGKTFHASKSMSPSYTHSQMVPYSDTHIQTITQFDRKPAPKTMRSKSTASWSLADPDVRRQRRVASYKVYTAEGKIKASMQRSFQWVKNKYSELRYGLL